MAECPSNAQIDAYLAKRAREILPLIQRLEQNSGHQKVLDRIEVVNHFRMTWTAWYEFFWRLDEEYRSAGTLEEFRAMSLSQPHENQWRAYCGLLEALREDCADRGVECLALSAGIGGVQDVLNGRLLLTPNETVGTEADLCDRARPKVVGYMAHGVMPKDGIDDVFVRLSVACKRSMEAEKKSTLTTKRTCPRISKAEANMKARAYLPNHPHATLRQLAKDIGCSEGMVSNLAVWKAVMETRRQESQPKKSKVVSLTPSLEKLIGAEDEALEELLEEQKAEFEPSPLDDVASGDAGSPRRGKVYRSRR